MSTSRSSSPVSRSRSRARPVVSHNRRATTDSDEDQSSWIADDICTHCGGLAPHGKLYCSRKCRDADAQDGTKKYGKTIAEEPGVTENLSKLRYPMTLSPTVQHSTSFPAKLKSRSFKATFSLQRQNSGSSVSSNEDELDRDVEHPSHTRQGSRSSTSTNSDFVETDLTTPSPWQSGIDLDEDHEFAKLDDPELQLPPAMCPSNQVLLRKGVTQSNTSSFKSSTSLSALHRTRASPTMLPLTHNSSGSMLNMQFNRLPGSTNLPMPVVFTAGVPPCCNKFTGAVSKSRSSESTCDYFTADAPGQCKPCSIAKEPLFSRACSLSCAQKPEGRHQGKPHGSVAWSTSHNKSKVESAFSPSRTYSENSGLCDCKEALSQSKLNDSITNSTKGPSFMRTNERVSRELPAEEDSEARGRTSQRAARTFTPVSASTRLLRTLQASTSGRV